MALIAFVDDRAQQSAYLISLADQAGVPHSTLVSKKTGWDVPQSVADLYDETAMENFLGNGAVQVVNAGSDLDTPRPDAACVYWKFDNGVDPGAAGENITNGRIGDLVFVAA